MTNPLIGQVALVTGGAKGFGAGIAQRLREAGARVWITGRDEAALKTAAATFGLDWIRADVTSPSDWDRVMAAVVAAAGRLDILVNNAGGGIKIAPAAEQTDATIAASIAVNLLGPLYGCRRAAPIMQAAGRGTIVNISSTCARYAWPGWGIYGAAKAGLDQFAKSLYLELRPKGVRVTTLIPSWGATGFSEGLGVNAHNAETRAKCIQPTEIGDLVVQIAALPAHLSQREVILLPLVQEISPL